MSEENIHVDTLVTKDMSKDELYNYSKYLEYRKEELLNINSSLQQKVEHLEKDFKETNDLALNLISKNKQLENIRKEAIDKLYCWGEVLDADFQQSMLKILNKGSGSDELQKNS